MSFKETLEKIRSLEIQSSSTLTKEGLKSLSEDIQKSKAETTEDLLKELEEKSEILAHVRDTEPALRNGLKYIKNGVSCAKEKREAKEIIKKCTDDYIGKMNEAKKKIAEIGEKRIRDGDVLMTHCHSTAVMNIIKKAVENGKKIEVVCTETRPRFQGRITAKELLDLGIPTTMIIDSAARRYMNDIDLVLFGADAVTSDGFLVNKIGTSMVALAAREARTTTCTCCETYKFDPETLEGNWEPVEERDPDEVWTKRPEKLKVLNPAFDFTPPELISFLVCEEGIINIWEASRIMKEKWS